MENKSGLRSLLSNPRIYDFFQFVIGGKSARKFIVENYINNMINEGGAILDVGCGTGYLLDYLDRNLKAEYLGYDLDHRYIDFAQRKYGSMGKFVCKSVTDIDLIDQGPFDVILAMGLLHHLNDKESRDLLSLCSRFVSDRGKVIFLDGLFVEGQSVMRKAILNNDRGKYVRSLEGYTDLIAPFFKKVETLVKPDLFYLPYTASIIICSK